MCKILGRLALQGVSVASVVSLCSVGCVCVSVMIGLSVGLCVLMTFL